MKKRGGFVELEAVIPKIFIFKWTLIKFYRIINEKFARTILTDFIVQEHLMDNITKQQNFWSENDDLVLKAIREGFLKTQQDMWGDLENWAKTGSGLPSTAGTTASIAFIRRGKIFVGHVGDSGIVLGEQDEDRPDVWKCKPLTR